MSRIKFLNEETGKIDKERILSKDATLRTDNVGDISPAVTQMVEYDHSGQTSSVSSTCGETENRRESDQKPDMTIEGILVNDQLEDFKALKEGQEITLVSDVHQGKVFVKRLTISQEAELISYIENGEEQLAFSFQLQLKQPE